METRRIAQAVKKAKERGPSKIFCHSMSENSVGSQRAGSNPLLHLMNLFFTTRLCVALTGLALVGMTEHSWAGRPATVQARPTQVALRATGPLLQGSRPVLPPRPQPSTTRPHVWQSHFRLPSTRPLTANELLSLAYNGSITANVPSGVYQVTLEKKQGSGWKPVQKRHTDGSRTTVTFTLAANEKAENFRVIGSKKRKFSPAQVAGVSQFDVEVNAADSGGVLTLANTGVIALNQAVATGTTLAGNTAVASGTLTMATATALADSSKATATTTTTAPSTAAAVEADIWKFSGDRLFYFNQLRGLQIFDVRDPAKPVKTGAIRMPAIGTQLQTLDDKGQYAVLFTRSDNGDNYKYNGGGMLRLVQVSAEGKPSIINTVELDGYAGESRLIGSKLYVITTGYGGVSYSSGWYSSWSWWHLHGYDLADPHAPVDLGFVSGGGHTPVLQASDGYLLVASTDYRYTYTPSYQWHYSSLVSAVDFEEDGKPHLVKTIETKEQVRDQFKMGVVNDAIVAVTQEPSRWEYNSGTSTTVQNEDGTFTTNVTNTWTVYPSKTWVETFPLDPAATDPLAQLHLAGAQGETLHATRFDGNRLYVVTFGVRKDGPEVFTQNYSWTWNPRLARDPLFIIDLADPANPIVRSELDIPGYSTYIEPDGDRLITVGREDNDVAVSLFDVANAEAPTQLKRVYPGKSADTNSYTWTEAEWEHRAVTYLRDQGRLIVPVQSHTGSSTQTIHVSRDSLALGPVVQMKDQARRGTSLKGYLVSISGRELRVHTDPPTGGDSKEVAWVELAWPVEQVFDMGTHLVQIESNASGFARSQWNWWGSSITKQNVIRLTSKSDLDEVLDSVALPNPYAGIVAATERKGTLFIAQHEPATSVSTVAHLRTWMLRVKDGRLVQVGDTTCEVPAVSDSETQNQTTWNFSLDMTRLKPAWPAEDKLVWFAPCQENFWFGWWIGWSDFTILPSRLAQPGQLIVGGNLTPVPTPIVTLPPADTTPPVNSPPPQDRTQLPVAVAFPISVTSTAVKAASAITLRREDTELPLAEVSAPFADAGYLFFSTIQRQQWNYFPLIVARDANATQPLSSSGPGGAKVKYAVADLRVLDFTSGITPIVRDAVSIPGTLLSASSIDESGAWLITSSARANESGSLAFHSLAYDGVNAHQVDAIDDSAHRYSYNYSTVAKDGLLFAPGYEYGYDSVTGYYTGRYVTRRYRQQQTSGKLELLGSEATSDYYTSLHITGDCLISNSYQSLAAWRINADATLTPLGTSSRPWSSMYYAAIPERAILSSDQSGVWLPVTDYGVEWLPFKTASTDTLP